MDLVRNVLHGYVDLLVVTFTSLLVLGYFSPKRGILAVFASALSLLFLSMVHNVLSHTGRSLYSYNQSSAFVTLNVLLTQAEQETKEFRGLPALSENRCLLLNCSDNQDNHIEHKMQSWLQCKLVKELFILNHNNNNNNAHCIALRRRYKSRRFSTILLEFPCTICIKTPN